MALTEGEQIVLQVKSEEWDGEFMDVVKPKDIYDRAILKAIKVRSCVCVLCVYHVSVLLS